MTKQLLVHRKFRRDSSRVLYLPLYLLDGTSFQSKDDYGHLATVTGALWTPQGRSFDGFDDLINCGSAAVLDNLAAFTRVIWVKPTTTLQNKRLISKGAQTPYNDLMWGTGNTIRYLRTQATTPLEFITVNTVTSGVWSMITVTIESNTCHIYLNGTECAYSTNTDGVGGLTSEAGDDFLIGNRVGADAGFLGVIGEVLIPNRTLTTSEIQNYYLATKWRYN